MEDELVTLSRKELKRAVVIEKTLEGQISNAECASLLGLSVRQVIRLKNSYRHNGAGGLIHGNRGRKPCHALTQEIKEKILALYNSKYGGSNCCHFSELLREREGLEVSVPSVRRILQEGGLKQKHVRRRPRAHCPRARKAQAGMMWQIDATPYAWLEDRTSPFALHAAIDDATGIVTGAVFRKHECMEGYFAVMEQGIVGYGLPLSLYSDKHTIFRSPNEKLTEEQELMGEEFPLSQFGMAMKDLNIEHIKANSPQAKGRVERLWGTLQDRLVTELKLLEITTMEEANRVLPELIRKHNLRFAVKAQSEKSAYLEINRNLSLEEVFAIREYRRIGAGSTISFRGELYTPLKREECIFAVRSVVEIRKSMSGKVFIWHNGKAVILMRLEKAQRVAA